MIFAARITFPHLAISACRKRPNCSGELPTASAPDVARISFTFGVRRLSAAVAFTLATISRGVASAWMLHEMKSRGIVTLAFVFNSVNPILVQGAALGDVPMLAGFDEDITAAITDGAEIEVDPQAKTVTVL